MAISYDDLSKRLAEVIRERDDARREIERLWTALYRPINESPTHPSQQDWLLFAAGFLEAAGKPEAAQACRNAALGAHLISFSHNNDSPSIH